MYTKLINQGYWTTKGHIFNQSQILLAKYWSPMMMSTNGNIFRVTGLCAGNSLVPVNSPHKGQWRGALMFSPICAWIDNWVNNREAGDLRHHRGHYDVNVMRSIHSLTVRGWICNDTWTERVIGAGWWVRAWVRETRLLLSEPSKWTCQASMDIIWSSKKLICGSKIL